MGRPIWKDKTFNNHTLPKTNIAPENWPSQKESSLPYLFSGAMLVSGRVLFQAWTYDCENSETERQPFDCITTCPIPKRKNSPRFKILPICWQVFVTTAARVQINFQPFPKYFGLPTIRQPSHEEKLITCRWSRCPELICEKNNALLSRSTKDSTKKKRNKTSVGPSDLELTASWLEY